MNLQTGQELLHYRLVEQIGEGGMGVVWRASDTSLGRDVAIKVLPSVFSEDADRLARFEREAKLLASLNHPNIATIHGLHEDCGVRFLAMELVAGEDLAQHVAVGPVPLAEALSIARQVAEALETAHENGIVHRDLKPANVRLTTDGQVKVLDFGLAKMFASEDSAQANLSMSPTLTSAGTVAGVILGTAAYMSPEQAKGQSVDRRADIWAFGVVLHEMLTGRSLFQGESVSEVLAAVLMKEPDWEALPADVPTSVRNLLRRCLRKDARSRLRDIGDARVSIEETIGGAPVEDEQAPAVPEAASPRSRPLVHAAWAVAVVAAAVVAGMAIQRMQPEPPVVKFEIVASDSGLPDEAVISPDGTKIAYVVDNALWVRDLDRLAPRKIVDDVNEMPFWSPDSSKIGYVAAGTLFTVQVAGGQAATICDTPGDFDTGAWGEDGVLRIVTDGIHEVSARGGDPREVLAADREDDRHFHTVNLLPENRGLLYVVHRQQGWDTIEAYAGGERRLLLRLDNQSLWNPLYSPTGHLVYQRFPDNAGIWAAPFSLSDLRVTGEPFLVAPDAKHPSVSVNGMLTYLPSSGGGELELVWVGRDGMVHGTIGKPQQGMRGPALSPDGRSVAVSGNENEERDIWIHDAVRNSRSRLTFADDDENLPRWTSDGKAVLFGTDFFSNEQAGWIKPADGGGERTALMADGFPSDISTDGRYVIFTRMGEGGDPDVWYREVESGKETPVVDSESNEIGGRLSPDGKWLAYFSNESGRREVYLRRFPTGEGKWLVSTDGARRVLWDKRGDRVYFTNQNALWEVALVTEPSVTLGSPRVVFQGGTGDLYLGLHLDVTSDGERFVAIRPVVDEEEKEQARSRGVVVVQNWYSEFRNR